MAEPNADAPAIVAPVMAPVHQIVPDVPVLDVVNVNRPSPAHMEDAIMLTVDRSCGQNVFIDEEGADIDNNHVLHELKQLMLMHAQYVPVVGQPVIGIDYLHSGETSGIIRALRHLHVHENEEPGHGRNHGFTMNTVKMMRNRKFLLFSKLAFSKR